MSGSAYTVKDLYLTLQGEGVNAGRPAVFCRFAGCNLWSGREEDRSSAACTFCDTDFIGGRRYTVDELAEAIRSFNVPFVVFTGGEPALQLDQHLIESVAIETAIETNGSVQLRARPDFITVSPKAGTRLLVTSGDELKLVYPQDDPDRYEHLDFRYFCLQPMDGPHIEANTNAAISYCLANPKWRLSLQTHKLIGLP